MVDLDAIARLDELVQDVLDGAVETDEALARLSEIRDEPLERPWPILLAGYALAGAALTPVLGGGWREAAAGASSGSSSARSRCRRGERRARSRWSRPLAAVAASFCAVALAQLGLEASPDVVTLAALVTFLPGMTLTIGMRELSTEHLQSGVANTASALVQLLGLVFGVGVGRSIAVGWFGSVGANTPEHGVLGRPSPRRGRRPGSPSRVTLRARFRDAPSCAPPPSSRSARTRSGAAVFGKDAAAFVAALAVGVVGGVAGSVLRRSSLVFIVPGVLMLVPGQRGLQQRAAAAGEPDRQRDHSRLRHVRDGDVDRLRPDDRVGDPAAALCVDPTDSRGRRRSRENRRRDRLMCRWLAYSGSPIRLEELLVNRERSLIDQSLHSRLGATTDERGRIRRRLVRRRRACRRLYRSTHPAWNDRNLRELAAGVSSPLFFAHIRASTGTAIQETNTHPFRYGRWLWMHNGLIREFPRIKRELVLAVDDAYYPSIEGTTDSETMFYLALTFGLRDDPDRGRRADGRLRRGDRVAATTSSIRCR